MSKNILVTGGSRGIGAAISLALSEIDNNIIFTYNSDINSAQATALKVKECSSNVLPLKCNQNNIAEILNTLKTIDENFGKIDILINNAAISQEKPFLEINNEDWDNVLAVNLRGPFIWSREILPDMISSGWGRIINISSIGGQWGGYNQVHYAAAKAGLINLTRSIAKIYSKNGITCNAIAPGLVNTNMIAHELSTPAGQKKLSEIPIGRIAEPEEIAATVAFLASDKAAYITGQTINLNGGLYFG